MLASYPIRFRNDSGLEVPAFAALKITGFDAAVQAVQIVRPDEDSLDTALVLINGQTPVAVGGFGAAADAGPVLAFTDGIPVAGSTLGTVADEWHLLAGNEGFAAWSDADDEDLAVVVKAGGGGGSRCAATCFDVIDETTLAGTFSAAACTLTEEHDANKYCGPVCVSDTACPVTAECTQCLPFYKSGPPDVSALVGDWDDANCWLDLMGSPKQFLRGCYTISAVATPGAIAIIDTTQPFYAYRSNPADCNSEWRFQYSLLYISGAFAKIDDPVQPDHVKAGRVTARFSNVILDSQVPRDVAENTLTLQQEVDAYADPESPYHHAPIKLPGSTVWLGTGSLPQVSLIFSAEHSGIDISGPGVRTGLHHVEEEYPNFRVVLSFDSQAFGYFAGFLWIDDSTVAIGPDYFGYASDPDWFDEGDAVCLWTYTPLATRNTSSQILKILTKTDMGGGVWHLELDGTIDEHFDDLHDGGGFIRYMKKSCLVSSISGRVFTLATPADAAKFTVGKDAWTTDGSGINDLYGERNIVVATDSGAGTVQVHRDVRLPYNLTTGTALCAGPYFEGSKFKHLTLGYIATRGNSEFEANDVHWTNYAGLGLAVADGVRLNNSRGHLDINNASHVKVKGGEWSMAFSEWSEHIDVEEVTIIGVLLINQGTKHLRISNSDIYGNTSGSFGIHFVDYNGGTSCDHLRLMGVRFWSNISTGADSDGDDVLIANCFLNTGVFITLYGIGSLVTGNRGPGYIVLAAGSRGILGPTACTIVDNSGGGWLKLAERENVGIQTLAITIAAVRYGASVKAMLDQMAYGLLTQGTLREFILAYTASIYSGAETGDLDYQDSGATTPAVADNDPVGLITDVSANANHPFASGGSRPVLKTNIVNGHPVWRFDGTRTMQFTGSGGFSNDGASFSYFAVVKPADRSGDYAILGAVATARVWRINSGTGYQNLEYSFISSVATSLSPVPLDRFSIVGVTYDHPTGTVTFWLNGQQDGQFVVTPVTFQNGTAYLGSRGGSDLFFNGDIAAYEKSTAVFADLQRQQLLLHWNEKFALEATGESPDIALAAAALQLRPRALAGIL